MSDLALASPANNLGILRPSRVEQHFLRTMLVTVACVLIFKVVYLFEVNVLLNQLRAARFVGEASDAAMRYIGLPHVIIGFLFLVTSRASRTARMRITILGLLSLGAVLCVAYGMAGGKSNRPAFAMVYLYFLVHELRDQAMFYTVFGDAPPVKDQRAFGNMVWATIAIAASGVALLTWATLGVFSPKHSLLDPSHSLAYRIVVAVVSIIGWYAAAFITLRYYARSFQGIGPMLREHAPFFRLMAGVVGVLGLALLLTQRPYSLILFHVISWYLFTCRQLSGNPPAAATANLWTRMRTSLKGFRLLHNGMVAGLLAIGIVWVFGFGKPAALNWLLAEEAFPYWTILHITVSFARR